MCKFKIGDNVKVINVTGMPEIKHKALGRIYTIKKISKGSSGKGIYGLDFLKLDRSDGLFYYMERRLELANNKGLNPKAIIQKVFNIPE